MGFLTKLFGPDPLAKAADNTLAGVVVVVGDASVTIQKVMELTFKPTGASLHTFSESQSLLQFIKDHSPGVVLLDASLKPQDGYDLCRVIRQLPGLAKIPAFILVSQFQRTDKEKLQSSMANGTINKPFDSRVFLRTIAEAMKVQ